MRECVQDVVQQFRIRLIAWRGGPAHLHIYIRGECVAALLHNFAFPGIPCEINEMHSLDVPCNSVQLHSQFFMPIGLLANSDPLLSLAFFRFTQTVETLSHLQSTFTCSHSFYQIFQ